MNERVWSRMCVCGSLPRLQERPQGRRGRRGWNERTDGDLFRAYFSNYPLVVEVLEGEGHSSDEELNRPGRQPSVQGCSSSGGGGGQHQLISSSRGCLG